jgi:hypothetical protein
MNQGVINLKRKQRQNKADDSYHGLIERVLVGKGKKDIIEMSPPPPPNTHTVFHLSELHSEGMVPMKGNNAELYTFFEAAKGNSHLPDSAKVQGLS